MVVHTVELPSPLDGHYRSQVAALAAAANEADGAPALSDAVLLGSDPNTKHLAVESDDGLAGYAAVLLPAGTIELAVAPAARGQGVGAMLLAAALAHGGKEFWTRGSRSAPHVLAARAAMAPVRHLWCMTAELPAPPEDAQAAPAVASWADDSGEYTIDTYRGPADDSGLLAVNAAAFAHLPDQGSWTQSDLEARMSAPWFDPEDLLVLRSGENIVGFHWTKVHHPGEVGLPGSAAGSSTPMGEVYVLALAPSVQGKGLARVLLARGLAQLAARGCRQVMLYVDDTNTVARRLYLREGFRDERLDMLYRSSDRGSQTAKPPITG